LLPNERYFIRDKKILDVVAVLSLLLSEYVL